MPTFVGFAMLFGQSACSTPQSEGDGVDAPSPVADPRVPEARSELPADPSALPEQGPDPAAAHVQSPNLDTSAPPSEAPGAHSPFERAAMKTEGTRIYAKTRNVWVREGPDSSTQWLGFLWFGHSVPLKNETPIAGRGCDAWYPVQPRGYVCADGTRATLDASDPVLEGIYPYSPNVDSPWPHAHYGETGGAERYAKLPSVREQRAREWNYSSLMAKLHPDGGSQAAFADGDAAPMLLPALPPTLQEERRSLKPFSTVAWSQEVEHTGRTWLLTGDLKWIPKDRVTVHERIGFRGVRLDQGQQLPLAFFRESDRPEFEKHAGDEFVETTRTFARLSWVALTGVTETVSDDVYWQTNNPEIYVRQKDAVIPELRKTTPWGEPLVEATEAQGVAQTADGAEARDAASDLALRPRKRNSWIHVSITGGWLVAYEDKKAVFTTLISPGRGGPPRPGIPPLQTASTPLGNFKITGKFATANMVSPGELVHSDVPWAQNFSGPFALHGAYWHNRWGEPKSGGCINLSPIDAQWLFEFSDPPLPEGWHGVRWVPGTSASTTVLVQR